MVLTGLGSVDVMAFGAIGNGIHDDTAAFQAAFNASSGRYICVSAGTYRITSTLTYNTSGNVAGLRMIGVGSRSTIFDNQIANGPMLSLDGSGTLSAFAHGAILEDFAIITTTSPVVSRGIDLRSQFWLTMNRLRIDGLSSDAIQVTTSVGDPDSSVFWTINNCHFRRNGGWGFHMPNGVLASGCFLFQNTFITENTHGGVRLTGLNVTFDQCGITFNYGPGILVPYINGQTFSGLIIRNSEIQENPGFDIDIQALVSGRIETTKFICDALSNVGVRLGDGVSGLVIGVTLANNHVRYTSGTYIFAHLKSTASSCRVENTRFNVASGAGLTYYIDEAATTNVIIEGINQILGGGSALLSPQEVR